MSKVHKGACFDKTLKNLSANIMIVGDCNSLDNIENLWLPEYKNIF